MTQEQREELERKHFEEQKMKEALAEKTPNWELFYGLQADQGSAMMSQEYWLKIIEEQFE